MTSSSYPTMAFSLNTLNWVSAQKRASLLEAHNERYRPVLELPVLNACFEIS